MKKFTIKYKLKNLNSDVLHQNAKFNCKMFSIWFYPENRIVPTISFIFVAR